MISDILFADNNEMGDSMVMLVWLSKLYAQSCSNLHNSRKDEWNDEKHVLFNLVDSFISNNNKY